MPTKSIILNIATIVAMSTSLSQAYAGSTSDMQRMEENRIKEILASYKQKTFNRWVEIDDMNSLSRLNHATKRVYIAISPLKNDLNHYSLLVHVREDYPTPVLETETTIEIKSYEVNCLQGQEKGVAYMTYNKNGNILKNVSVKDMTKFESIKKFILSPQGQACSGKPFEKLLFERGLLDEQEQAVFNDYIKKVKIERLERIEDRQLEVPHINSGN